MTRTASKVLTPSTINPCVLKAEYAVRGEIALKAEEIRDELKANPQKYGFDKVVNCNIGNPQQLDQKPLTYLRQIASLTEYPELLDHPNAAQIYPPDVLARAAQIVRDVHSVGAYSHSKGVQSIRQSVARFIQDRDGFPADPESIYLTTGASTGVSNLLQLIISHPNVGILIPIPQYPLYTAALALNNAHALPYYLSENNGWALDIDSLKATISESRKKGLDVRALVVINPGNPTGAVLSEENMRQVIQLAWDEKLILMADEVYQSNIYSSKPFHSFKKLVRSSAPEIAQGLELVSFHSISKGQVGECGRRGGYFEIVNFSKEAEEQVYKLASIQLCPGLAGQIGVEVMVNPPKGESGPKYQEELGAIQESLKRRAEKLEKAFGELEGVSCNEADGALYLFPRLRLPPKFHKAASSAQKSPDAFYCLELLKETGICTIPGEGFGQEEGTLHLRTTFLMPEEELDGVIERWAKFHKRIMDEYRD